MKTGLVLFLSLSLFLCLASTSSPVEKLERKVQGIVHAADNFVEKFTQKNYHHLNTANSLRHAATPQHQRKRHIIFGNSHVDTTIEPSFEKNEHYKVIRRHSEPEDLHEYYISLKQASWKAIEKIEADFGWEKKVKPSGMKQSRLATYLPHNTFVFAGTEEEALKLQDHDLVYWVGARDPSHKLCSSFGEHPEERIARSKKEKEMGLEFEADVVRLHFHSQIITQEQVNEILKQVESILEHNNIKATVTSEFVRAEEFFILVKCDNEEDTHMAALKLAPHPSVHYVDQPPIFKGYNDLANQFVEIGELTDKTQDYVSTRNTPLSFLDGDSYLVGIADTGIDWDNCLFYDEDVSMRFDRENPSHRKIFYYDTTWGDRLDNYFHGTHMTGTLVGNEQRIGSYPLPEGTFNGLVQDAKVVMVDIGTPEAEFQVPSNLANLFDASYLKGAKVNVYGWGSAAESLVYNDLNFRTDEYMYLNRDFIPFFATGNRNFFRFPVAIASPASSKNPIAVSMTRGFHQATTRWYGRTGTENRDLYNFFYTQICSDFTNWWNDPAFCASFGFTAPCQQYQFTNICPNFQSPSDCCRFSYFRSLCCGSFFQENFNTSESQSLFNEFVLDGQGNRGPLFDGRNGVDLVFPGTGIVSAYSDQNTNTRNCASNKGVLVLNGTSMATAVAGGAAVKILQYFEQGYYPWGDNSRSDREQFAPSSSLVKALMMSAAVPMETANGNQRQFYFDMNELPTPNSYEGMGAPVLSRVLHIQPADTNNDFSPYGPRRIVVGSTDADPNHIYLDERGYYRGCFRTSLDAQHFSVTITWNDPPANTNSGLGIVNNLDLMVMDVRGENVYTGNAKTSFDSLNTYEQARFDFSSNATIPALPPSGDCPDGHPTGNCIYQQYIITIKGETLITRPAELPFSLVVHAWFNDAGGNEQPVQIIELGVTGDSFNGIPMFCDIGVVRCPRGCSGYGECNGNGVCECFDGYTGVDCSLSTCQNDCSGNGVCDGEVGTCACTTDYVGNACEVYNPSGEAVVIYLPTNCSCECDGISTGAAAGIGVGCFFLGLVIGMLLGAYLGIQWLVARKKKKVAEIKQKLAARDNMGGGDAGVDPEGP